MFESLTDALKDLWKGGRGWTLVVIGFGWFLFSGFRFGYPALLPYITDSLDISLTSGGFLLSGLMLAYAIGQIPGGFLSDRIGEGNTLFLSALFVVVAVLVISASSGLYVLFFGTVLFGLALAVHAPARFTLLSSIYSKRAGTAIAITQASGNVGSSGLPIVASLFATYFSWRFGFGFMIPLFAVVALGIWLAVPKQPNGPTSAVDDVTLDTFRYIFSNLSDRSIAIVFGVQIFISFIFNGFVGFYPSYLVHSKGVSAAFAASLLGLFFGVGVLVKLVSGALNDIIGPKRTLLLVIVGMAITLSLLPLAHSISMLVILTILLSILNGYSPVTQTFLVNALPSDMKGTGFGILRSSYAMIASLGPLSVGIFADSGLFDEAFLILAGLSLIALLLTLQLPRDHS